MIDQNTDYSPTTSFPTLAEWEFMMQLGQALVKTGFMPKGVDTAEKAAAIMMKGRELGIPPMEAIANISIINGKPTLQAKLMMALVKRAYGRDAIWVEETNDKFAKVGYRRGNKAYFMTFTMDDAERAGLTRPSRSGEPSMYTKYPGPMLRSRCISAVCIMEFPEVTGGLYVPGELGEDVIVDESGEVITVDVNSPAPARTQAPPQQQNRKAAPPAAQPAQIEAPKSQSGPVIQEQRQKAEPVPAQRNASAAPNQQQRRQTTEDKKHTDLKVSLGALATKRGVGNTRLKELLKNRFGKDAGDLTFAELQQAYNWIANATAPELSGQLPGEEPAPASEGGEADPK